jgi:transcriptional regulator with PAS, ATPase and Fis domain
MIKNEENMKDSRHLSKTSPRQVVEELMGNGKVISKVLDEVEMYAQTNEPVLIEGATGVGKELIANYLYGLSGRKKIVPLNCGLLSKELIASTLFGSKKGAFTGAQDKKGYVEEAEGGILFLDEFNSIPFDVQVSLLRLMEHGTFTKVGDTVERKANVRIIAAGNKSFKKSAEKGELRQDLYERFFKTFYIPTLNERIEDINYFIDRFIVSRSEKTVKTVSISDEARKMLINHEWTGNIRELKHFVEKLVVEVEMDKESKEYVIREQLVRERFNKGERNSDDNIREDDCTLQTACDTAAKKAIMRALNKTGGNNEEAIKLLGISHGKYYNLKKKYGI